MKKSVYLAAILVASTLSNSAFAVGHGGLKVYGKMDLRLNLTEDVILDSDKMEIGVRGTEDLGNGMTVIYQVELEGSNADSQQTTLKNDKSFLAIQGLNSKFSVGRKESFSGWACDSVDIFKEGGAGGCYDEGKSDDFFGFETKVGDLKFGLAMLLGGTDTPSGSVTNTQVGMNYNSGPVSFGAVITDGDSIEKIQLGGAYKFEGFTLGTGLGENDGDSGIDITFSVISGADRFKFGVSSFEETTGATTEDNEDVYIAYHLKLSKRTAILFENVSGDNDHMGITLSHSF